MILRWFHPRTITRRKAFPVRQAAPARNVTDDLRPILERLYQRRYSADDLHRMRGVWTVLVQDFFQRRIDPASSILDVGAGACLFINEVRAARRVALDANPELTRYAAPGVETLVTDDLTFAEIADDSLGHVFLSNFLEHLSDHRAVIRVLSAVHRKLKPGGSVLILQPNFRLDPARYFDTLDHSVILTDASLVEAVEVVGFRIVELRRRFLPFTSKSRLPKWKWLVKIYLRLRPVQWFVGKQTYVRAVKPGADASSEMPTVP